MSDRDASPSAVDRALAALGGVLTHRWLILLINLATAYIIIQLNRHYIFFFDGLAEHNHALAESLTGVGVLMIGWGVALEERQALRHIFRMPDLDAADQTAIDHLCHYYGVGLLLMGLFSEILIEFVKLPNEIVNTAGLNEFVLGVSDALLGVCLIFLLCFSWSLARGVEARSHRG